MSDDVLERVAKCIGNVYELVDELADEVERLRAENERLRAALTEIRDTAPDYHTERFVDRVLRGVELMNGDDRCPGAALLDALDRYQNGDDR